jgi:hypothetical protein
MEVSEIVVGKRYRYIYDMDHKRIMLGIGMRKLKTENEFIEKHLVLIESPDKEFIGRMIQEGDNATPGYWDTIVEEDCGLYIVNIG